MRSYPWHHDVDGLGLSPPGSAGTAFPAVDDPGRDPAAPRLLHRPDHRLLSPVQADPELHPRFPELAIHPRPAGRQLPRRPVRRHRPSPLRSRRRGERLGHARPDYQPPDDDARPDAGRRLLHAPGVRRGHESLRDARATTLFFLWVDSFMPARSCGTRRPAMPMRTFPTTAR